MIMRIIAGKLGGRTFQEPHGHKIHPMSEKVRGALFNALGDIAGLSVLDAFAGSGALSFEAISRGAKQATAIDMDKNAYAAVKRSAKELGVEAKVKIVRANAGSWSDNNSNKEFDVILLDPPYDDIRPDLLEKLAAHAKTGGVIVLSLPPRANISLTSNLQPLTSKSYGDAQLVFYRKK